MIKPHILIVGAGAWGSSTAVALLKSGQYSVTLIDRAQVLPAEDAASTDINKIVRFDYREDIYADLAFKALELWRGKEWEGMYFETGTVVVAPQDTSLEGTIANVSKRCPEIRSHSTAEEVQRALDPQNKGVAGDMTGRRAYSNPWGGWVNAHKATSRLITQTAELGGTVVPAAEAVSWIIDDGDVKGIKCADGREFRGDKVIAAAGAWLEGLMGDLLPKGLLASVGITVAAFHLSEEEYERYKDIPVIMGWDETGFYSMPPTHDRILKFGLSEHGYTVKSGTPRTTLTPGAVDWHNDHKASWLPERSFEVMRYVTNRYFPEFKDRPFDFTRMCPIPDTFDGDYLLDYHKQYPSLLIASGGNDHSYKMMPVIGDLVKARMEGTIDPRLAKLWAIRSPTAPVAAGHAGRSVGGRLDVEDVAFAGMGQVHVGTGWRGNGTIGLSCCFVDI